MSIECYKPECKHHNKTEPFCEEEECHFEKEKQSNFYLNTREELAEFAHREWSKWMKYLFSKCALPIHPTQAGVIIPPQQIQRWTRQMNTEYKDLTEEEKESDRKEADEILKVIINCYRKDR